MADDEFSEVGVRDFLVQNGGKAKNELLVRRFRRHLSDPDNKALNRDRFKEYVNAVATIKTEDGEKYLVLKKKYRDYLHSVNPTTDSPVEVDGSDGVVEDSEHQIPKVEVEIVEEDKKTLRPSESKSRVLDVAQSFEKKAEEEKASADAAKVISPARQKRDDDDDDESVTSTLSNVTLSETERSWMIAASDGNTPMLAKLLIKEPHLAKQKDFTSGFTALHWAAKHGKKEMVKLLAGRPGLGINTRSHGGYTPLHVAVMHGQESVIQMLISDFKADVNIRDYSGKKAKQHMRKNTSNYIQQMLQGTIKSYGIRPRARSNSMDKKRGSGLFFNKPLKWGSAESLRSLTPPESPTFKRNMVKELMPPPKFAPSKKSKKKRKDSMKDNMGVEMRRAESEPDLGFT